MPSIYLKQTQSSYNSGSVSVSPGEPYQPSKLFKSFKHTFTSPSAIGNIYIRKDDKSWSGAFIITRGSGGSNGTLKEAHVYFNNYDKNHENPLLFVLIFNGVPSPENKYYKRSEFKSKLTGNESVGISSLHTYTNDQGILDALISENDQLTEILTYDIGRKEGDSNGNGGNGKYNGKKICVEDDTTKGQPQLSGTEFRRYKHTPVNGTGGNKKACVIFDKNLLLNKSKSELQNIQGQVYISITVYFGTRAKKTSVTSGPSPIDVPLLIELTKTSTSSDQPEYYVHKRKSNTGGSPQYYWEQLPGNGGTNTLKDLLEDMGFGMKKGDNGYEQLKKILTGAAVNGVGDDEDLSDKFERLTGKQLQAMLKQTVPPSDGDSGSGSSKYFLELLLQKIEFDLLDSVVILLDKKKPESSQYGESDVTSAVTSQLQPPRTINRVSMNGGGKKITVNDETTSGDKGQCVKEYGYKLIKHDFSTLVSDLGSSGQPSTAGIRFIIQSETGSNQYHQLMLYDKTNPDPQNLQYTYYNQDNKEVYVYYYSEDPRPLLVCYGENAYKIKKPKYNKENPVKVNYTQWHTVSYISKCVCENGGTTGPNQKILKALNDVTGFLNPVQINPKEIPREASAVTTSGGTKQYTLHTYIPGTTIKMGITRHDVGCYKSFKYQPYGQGGSYDNTFRLGNVIHTKTNAGTQRSPLKYTELSQTYKYHPLVGVTVYYYDKDSAYADPLLIELEFKKNGDGGDATGPKEYYKLDKAGDGLGATLTWTKDTKASSQMGSNPTAVEHLDKIRHSLKKVIKILIDKQLGYPLCVSQQAGGNGGYSQNGDTNIQVNEYSEGGCNQLALQNYKCYVHKVSELNGGGFDYNTIGGLKFYISGTNSGGQKDIEITLYNNGGGSSTLEPITYNTCMKDIYVFFYCKNGGDQDCPSSTKPTAPLMLLYNKKYYKPESIDNYFTKWVCEKELAAIASQKPCGGDAGPPTLIDKLNDVNRALNRICLTHKIGGTTSQYGISKPTQPPLTEPNIELDRIKVTKLTPKTPNTRPYCKLVHRTMNAFDIGDIWYGDQDITQGGVKINGGDTIKVDIPNHTTNFLSTGSENTPNTVVAYYHKDDNTYKLPQLIVLLHTEKAIEQGDDPIKASDGSKYGYYVLSTGDSGHGYKYEWRSDSTGSQFKLDDPTEFSLLNSVVILVEKQKQYEESVIKNALTNSKDIRSPGNDDGVNRLQNRDITVNTNSDSSGKCVSTYGYKLLEHDLTVITAPIHGIKPILGLRFLIPSDKAEGNYDEISLYNDKGATGDSVGPLYHTNTNNTVCVYFYGQDPRPLLMCFGTGAYIPKKTDEAKSYLQVSVDYTIWTNVDGITKCVCDNGETESSPNKEILETLLKVVLLMNPVQLNPRKLPNMASYQIITTESPKAPKTQKDTTYKLHKFTASQTVKMKITRESVECYEKYTYESNGTSSNGDGFRLGYVHYSPTNHSSKFNKLDYNSHTSQYRNHPLVKTTVFYYDHDKKYEEPLLIELQFKVNKVSDTKEYYKLEQVGYSLTWDLDGEAKEAIGKGDSDNKNLINYLDKVRYQFKKVLQICIAVKQTKTYQAKLLDRDSGSGVESNEHISVQVTEDNDSGSISGTGFRCFKHGIGSLASPELHKFGALQFFIPDKDTINLVKLNLHESSNPQPIEPLYYNCGMGDICVYFYGGNDDSGGHQYEGDPRPLLLCYNNKAFRASSITNYNRQIWYKGSSIQNCGCNERKQKYLLEALVKVSNFMNPVWIDKRTQFPYKIHKFNGKDIKIKVDSEPSQNGFCYHKYTHSHEKPGFRLGNITYNSEWIVDKDQPHKCITSLTSKSPKYTPASEIVVYYYRGDQKHDNPLLVVLCSNSCGSTITCTCKPYYELQRSRSQEKNRRMYKKEDKNINLDTSKGGELEKLLNSILYYISNSLQINLGFRTKIEFKYPGERGKQIPTIKHDKYEATVYENESSKKFKKTTETVQVQVSEVIEIKTASGKKTGYQCYQHKLTNVNGIDNFGGLRLFLWDNRASDDNNEKECKITPPNHLSKHKCCELDLYENATQPSDSSCTKKIDPIAYTTCKGDLYVYFYGSDPRPMLLCYNNHSYAPTDLQTYSQKWCLVSSIKSCECSDKGLTYPASLLQQLYQISMFLNPVRLWETIAAYEKVKVEIEISYLLYLAIYIQYYPFNQPFIHFYYILPPFKPPKFSYLHYFKYSISAPVIFHYLELIKNYQLKP